MRVDRPKIRAVFDRMVFLQGAARRESPSGACLLLVYRLRDPFLVIDFGEARLVVFPHGPRLGVLGCAEDFFVCLAAPVDGWRMGLGVPHPLLVGHI